MTKIIVANLKMCMSTKDTSEYIKSINKIEQENVIICPTNIYVPYFLNKKYKVGLQNISSYDLGPYTGDVSANQASTMGIKYALVGHSERRIHQNEKDEEINKKITQALKYGMIPILCVGETLKEKRNRKKIVKKQLEQALKNTLVNKVIIAYEPVWAVGTNVIPTNKEIEEMINYIRGLIKKRYDKTNIKVLYGGSITKENVSRIKQIENIDGILVGSSSQIVDEFMEIIQKYLK